VGFSKQGGKTKWLNIQYIAKAKIQIGLLREVILLEVMLNNMPMLLIKEQIGEQKL